MKRGMDIVLGTLLSLLALPAIAVLAVAVAVSLRTWPFFVQHRVGRHGQLLAFPKLRTLPRSAPRYAPKHEAVAHGTTALCRRLRELHLDELPQLLLVPLGHLSLVGPRPELPNLHADLPADFARLRTSIRPGCTGLWQVGADTAAAIPAHPEWDRAYVAHRSLRLDAWILWRTLPLLVGLGRPVRFAQVPRFDRLPAPVPAPSAPPTEALALVD